ncbi:MAG: hypothetical protein M3288_05085 [Thermoproteota archaeon]|nr:hypothetical protein [Thermoproteota archaeon]
MAGWAVSTYSSGDFAMTGVAYKVTSAMRVSQKKKLGHPSQLSSLNG